MNTYLEQLLQASKKLEFKEMIADGIVCAGPCYLFDIHLAASSGGATANVLYFNTTPTGLNHVHLNTITSTSFNYLWSPPLFCGSGLYLDVGSYLAGALFHFLRMDR